MSALEEIVMLAGMMLATFGVRYAFLAYSGKIRLSASMIDALQFVPVAVLSAICVPVMIAPQGQIWLSPANEYLIAGLFAIAVSAWTRHLLLTIVLGMSLFLALRFLL